MNQKNSFSIQLINWVLPVCISLIFFSSCGDTTDIGVELFDEDDLKVSSTDTISIEAKTVLLDSVRVFNIENTVINTFLLGELEDPYLGNTTASLISEVHFAANIANRQILLPGFRDDDVLDSMVLVLAIDTSGFYGMPNARFDFEVFRLTESINTELQIFSNFEVAFDETVIGSADNVRIPLDSSAVYFPSLGTTINEFPQVRIPLNEQITKVLFEDLADLASDSAFIEVFNGIRVEATPSTGNSIIGVNIASNDVNSRIETFYSRGDTTLLYEYALNDLTRGISEGRKYTDFDRDISGAPVENFVNESSDSLLFMQSMLGTTIELDLSAIFNIEDVLINQAILEMTIADLDGDNLDTFEPVETVIISYRDENGESSILEEINEGLAFNQLAISFGGSVQEEIENGKNVFQYKMNITRSIIEMLDGDVPTSIFITPLQITERANRSILYGPNHSEFPLKLNLSLTSL